MATTFEKRDSFKHGLKRVYQLHINHGTSFSLVLKNNKMEKKKQKKN